MRVVCACSCDLRAYNFSYDKGLIPSLSRSHNAPWHFVRPSSEFKLYPKLSLSLDAIGFLVNCDIEVVEGYETDKNKNNITRSSSDKRRSSGTRQDLCDPLMCFCVCLGSNNSDQGHSSLSCEVSLNHTSDQIGYH